MTRGRRNRVITHVLKENQSTEPDSDEFVPQTCVSFDERSGVFMEDMLPCLIEGGGGVFHPECTTSTYHARKARNGDYQVKLMAFYYHIFSDPRDWNCYAGLVYGSKNSCSKESAKL